MSGLPMLTILTLLPLFGGVVVAATADRKVARGLALGFSFLVLVLTLGLWKAFDATGGALQFVERVDWIPSLGVQYFVGADGLSLLMLLLTALEGFSVAETARITGTDAATVETLLGEAAGDIDREARTSVLIIEDEPLIAMELEQIVRGLGHDVAGIATTHEDAIAAFEDSDAGLVLADIQLADGSSGIDAVQDILALAPVPAIFITAFPERLLTGHCVEPTFLISKPFRENTVRAAISQSLLFTPQLAA